MTTDDGIVDVERNPFAKPSWVKQGYRFTTTRAKRMKPLLGLSVSQIKKRRDDKFANYPAFIGIRWGYAEIANNKLIGTKKWNIEKDEWLKENESISTDTIKKKPPAVPTQQKTIELNDLISIRNEIERRRKILIERAHDKSIQMDSVDRAHIIEYLEKENLPQKPEAEAQLLKEFVSSSLSRNRGRYLPKKKLKELYNETVVSTSLPKCLCKIFSCTEFLDDEYWLPEKLAALAIKLKEKENDEFGRFVLNLTEQIANVMQNELAAGLDNFYKNVEIETKDNPKQAWKFMEQFTKPIYLVGPGLMSDFLKNSGFPYFVKIDHHLKKEFPALLPLGKKSDRYLFIYAWHLCEELGMTPFVFDHIMYQWGRAKL